MRIPFIGQGAIGRSEVVNSERLVNLYPQLDKTGKAVVSLYGTPGLSLLATLGSGPHRGSLAYDGVGYFVSGGSFYSINTSYAATLRGSIASDTGYVSMATNGLVVLIVDGSLGYIYTIGGAFAQITDGDFPATPIACAVLDNVFIVVEGGSQRIWTSVDGTTWEAGDFASAETVPDNLLGIIVDHQEMGLFGEESSEIWYNQGGSGFTFARRAMIESGTASTGCIAKLDNSVLWLDNHLVVRRLNGYTPTRVSSHNIEYRIGTHTKAEISAATAFAYHQEGHAFYQLTVGNETFVYDAAIPDPNLAWHTRRYMIPLTGEFTRHRAETAMEFNGIVIVGDYQNGRIYEYDLDTYTDNGEEISSIGTYRHLDAEGKRVFYPRCEIEIESGIGLQSGQGIDPQIELRWSRDGGRTWSNWYSRDIGGIGLYNTRARWNALGSAYDMVFEFRITDPIKRVIANANIEAVAGR